MIIFKILQNKITQVPLPRTVAIGKSCRCRFEKTRTRRRQVDHSSSCWTRFLLTNLCFPCNLQQQPISIYFILPTFLSINLKHFLLCPSLFSVSRTSLLSHSPSTLSSFLLENGNGGFPVTCFLLALQWVCFGCQIHGR